MQNPGTGNNLISKSTRRTCMVNGVNSSSQKGHNSANQPKLKQYEHTESLTPKADNREP